ncbi:MAG: EAL domain-containing protein [Gammaproteobacteria bacterium]|nr:EAL domain-containing protein [Gammaproteobacteria bacterium]
MSKDPIKLTISLGFTGVLALMGLISFISLSQMTAITEQMDALLNETNAKITASNTMRDSIRLRGDTLNKMYLTDDFFERDELRLEIAKHALRYKVARDVLYTYRMSSKEAKLLDQIMQQTRFAKSFNDNAADNLLSDKPLQEIKEDLLLANNARHDMLSRLDKLVLLQEEISRSVIKDSKEYQKKVSDIILFLSLAAFFIALYIAQLVIRETSRKNSEIHFQATHDELTKLVNRKEFNHRLKSAFKTAKDDHENHALCFLDLDKFKAVNDTCGHKAGDELLIQLTRTIKNHIRSHDTLARIGGDEFGLLLESCSLDKAIEIAEGIVNLIKNHEFKWQNKTFHVGVSIGLVMINRDTKNIEKTLSQADTACYAAKDMGRNQVQIHGLNEELKKNTNKELTWVADIKDSEAGDRFSLYLQKIKTIQTDSNKSIYEVLLRLHDDEGTLISLENYVPAAERFNLMKDVDVWVITKALEQLSNYYKKNPDNDIQLFINVSANSLSDHGFTDFVIQQIRENNISPNSVCLEVSEKNAIKNIDQTINIISELRKHNVKFSLDNFGSSMSSFSYLKNINVNYLKIDGNIVKNMSHSTADKAMIAAINQIGKVMNIETIANHVEDAFTLNQLREMGIDYAQGFHLDKPRLITEQIESLRESIQKGSAKH